MKRFIAAGVLLLAFSYGQAAKEESGSGLVLPNPNLLRCGSSDCYSLWLEKSPEANAIFPKQFTIDMNQNCLYGFTVRYDKSGSVAEIKSAIDKRYGKWALSGNGDASVPVKLWRVEAEKFAIQLSIMDKKDEKANRAEAGTKQAICIAFGGRSACDAR